MGFNFNSIDTTNKEKVLCKDLKRGVINEVLKDKMEEAKKHGNIGLMFFYHFLDRLVYHIDRENVTNPDPKINDMMNDRPTNILKGLKDILEFNEKYGFGDAEAIKQVHYVLQFASVK
jgi:hypothetical protein